MSMLRFCVGEVAAMAIALGSLTPGAIVVVQIIHRWEAGTVLGDGTVLPCAIDYVVTFQDDGETYGVADWQLRKLLPHEERNAVESTNSLEVPA